MAVARSSDLGYGAPPGRTRAVLTLGPPVAAVAALLIVVGGLAEGAWPTARLWVICGVLAGGLLAAALTRLAGARRAVWYVHAAAALAALVLIAHALPEGSYQTTWVNGPIAFDQHAYPAWPVSPLWVAAFVLGAGLVARPAAALAADWREPAAALAALTAMLILLWGLASQSWSVYRGQLIPNNGVANAALAPEIELLALALVVASRPGRRSRRSPVTAVALALPLAILAVRLAFPPGYGLFPAWTFWWSTALCGIGVAVTLSPWRIGRPSTQALVARVEDLSRTRRGALDAQAAELRRIERDLHDGAQVQLVALTMKLGRAEARYADRAGGEEVAAILREAREDTTAAIRTLRELARGIAPAVLANRGLEAAVRSLAQRADAEVAVSSQLGRRPPPAVERAAYFVVAEALANATKHASGSRVEVALSESGGDLIVEVTDFGPGGANLGGGGLTGLRQRVEALDGRVRLTSPAGVGTQVEVAMPCGW